MDNELESQSNFIFYSSKERDISVKVRVIDENIWVSQEGLAEIFEVSKSTISEHLVNIFNEGELEQDTTVRKFRTVVSNQRTYNVQHYNLDAIISVGYRVNSYKATQFRKWATQILKEYMIKGFTLDDERLKQGKIVFDKDYFDELLERIREIRASERRFYQKVTDLFIQASYDYDKNSPITQNFFAQVQNKLEYAVTGQTAAEIIQKRANHQLPTMGLTSWKNQKQGGKILTSDITIAKNYLTEEEINKLNRLVNMFLDYAESQVAKHVKFSMEDWHHKLNAFLQFNEYEILENYGTVKKSIADKLAKEEYTKFRPLQDANYESDFDKVCKHITNRRSLAQPHKQNDDTRASDCDEKPKNP